MKYTKQEKMSERTTKIWCNLLRCGFVMKNNMSFERENVAKLLEEAAEVIRIQEMTIEIQKLEMKNITLQPGKHSIKKGKYVHVCCQETKEEDCERCNAGEERCESEKSWEEVLLLNLLKYICEHSDNNSVDKPVNKRYVAGEYECWNVAEELCKDKKPWEAVLFFNVFKYVWRYSKKNGVDDLRKAKNYLEKLIHEIDKK